MTKVKEWADKNLQGDKVIWAVVFALSMISILVVYSSIGTLAFKKTSSPEALLLRHTMHVLIGLAAMWFAHKVDYRYYSKISRLALLVSIPLLIYTFVNGTSVNDAARWIEVPLVGSFQPSDFASLALIVNLAAMLSKRQQNIEDIKESLIPILFWCGTICGLIALTNMSTAILLLITCMLIMFIGRVPMKYLAMLFFVGILFGALAFKFGSRGGTMINRIKDFIAFNQGEKEPSFQNKHGFIAVATGGIFGKGPGNSDQRNILPNPYADFIFAIYVEEYGIIGAVVLVALYLLLLHRGMKAAYNSERAFGGLLSAGLCFDLVCQAMVNMGVVVGLGPVTGQPLPLISMGGTSMVFTGLALGIVLSVSRGEQDKAWEQGSKEEKAPKEKVKESKTVSTAQAA
ncbi:MAG TPA: FtsW/RodA/SpoVE family cell cycle protein [Chryseosolibacter sp.]